MRLAARNSRFWVQFRNDFRVTGLVIPIVTVGLFAMLVYPIILAHLEHSVAMLVCPATVIRVERPEGAPFTIHSESRTAAYAILCACIILALVPPVEGASPSYALTKPVSNTEFSLSVASAGALAIGVTSALCPLLAVALVGIPGELGELGSAAAARLDRIGWAPAAFLALFHLVTLSVICWGQYLASVLTYMVQCRIMRPVPSRDRVIAFLAGSYLGVPRLFARNVSRRGPSLFQFGTVFFRLNMCTLFLLSIDRLGTGSLVLHAWWPWVCWCLACAVAIKFVLAIGVSLVVLRSRAAGLRWVLGVAALWFVGALAYATLCQFVSPDRPRMLALAGMVVLNWPLSTFLGLPWAVAHYRCS